jgi:hypothetical protein
MEAGMAKIILVLVATAVPAFAAGVWTQATLAGRLAAESIPANNLATISSSEMQLKVKPDDLPVQYMIAPPY